MKIKVFNVNFKSKFFTFDSEISKKEIKNFLDINIGKWKWLFFKFINENSQNMNQNMNQKINQDELKKMEKEYIDVSNSILDKFGPEGAMEISKILNKIALKDVFEIKKIKK
jgi:hypothetical protein